MGFNEFISKLFGNKASRDMREIQPWVNKVKAVYPQISALSNDELRAASAALKEKIQGSAAPLREKIAALKSTIEETELEKRESIFNQIDKLEKEVLEKLDRALDQALPEAFAIVKDSARRFAENEEVEVTATDFDRMLAAKFDFVTIDGDTVAGRKVNQNKVMSMLRGKRGSKVTVGVLRQNVGEAVPIEGSGKKEQARIVEFIDSTYKGWTDKN